MSVKWQPTATVIAALGVQPDGPLMAKAVTSAHRRMGKYVPGGENSHLNKNVKYTKHSIIYDSSYAHYQYIGKLYVMKNGKGAYYSPNYGFWSDKGQKKTPTDRSLHHYIGGPYWAEEMMSAESEDFRIELESYMRSR